MVAVLPALASTPGTFFAAWFTYWPSTEALPPQTTGHWFTLQGTIAPDALGQVELTMYRATAGSSGALRPDDVHRVGRALWQVLSCNRAQLTYTFDDDETLTSYRALQGSLIFERADACAHPAAPAAAAAMTDDTGRPSPDG